MADYDLLGNIAIIKSEGKTKKQKLKQAEELLKKPSIKTVLEKATNVKGRLRTIKTRHVKGVRNLIAEHKENNCLFKFNVESCYFSPRLSGERKLIAEKVKRTDSVLVMFAGIGVYPIVIYKLSRPEQIIGIEIGKECCSYFKENLKLNKIPENRIEIIRGNVKKKVDSKEKFDVVIMARPNLKESFLKYGLNASKKNTRLFYYGFCNIDEFDDMVKDLKNEARDLSREIKIVDVVRAGEIAPYKFRYRIEIRVLN